MIRALALHKIRLELDRALRGHPFFGRLLRGDVSERAYGDLVTELAAVLSASDGDLANNLETLACHDLETIMIREQVPLSSCMAASYGGAIREAFTSRLARVDVHDVTVALLGSSWCRDATARLDRRFRGATYFLNELGRLGPLRFEALGERIQSGLVDPRHLYTFAELMRGALLGVATYLDAIWPAPVVSVMLAGKN